MRDILSCRQRVRPAPLLTLANVAARLVYKAGSGVLEILKTLLAWVVDFSILSRDDQEIAARLYAPSTKPLPVLLCFHGDGFTMGSSATHDAQPASSVTWRAARLCRWTTGWRPNTSFSKQ